MNKRICSPLNCCILLGISCIFLPLYDLQEKISSIIPKLFIAIIIGMILGIGVLIIDSKKYNSNEDKGGSRHISSLSLIILLLFAFLIVLLKGVVMAIVAYVAGSYLSTLAIALYLVKKNKGIVITWNNFS